MKASDSLAMTLNDAEPGQEGINTDGDGGGWPLVPSLFAHSLPVRTRHILLPGLPWPLVHAELQIVLLLKHFVISRSLSLSVFQSAPHLSIEPFYHSVT